jgi:hypothetical protein
MGPKEISKAIATTFDGKELERGKFLLRELSHWYIECCKLPALRLGLGEAWADRTKYIIVYAIPTALAVLLEWAVSGSLL